MVNFAMPKLFSLIQSHLFIFDFVSCILGVTSKNSLLCESVELHIGAKSLSGLSGWEGPLAVSSNWGYSASWVGIIVQSPFSVGPQATFSTKGLSHWQGSLPGQDHLMCSVMWQSPGLGLSTPRGRSLGSTARCSVEFFLELPRLLFRLPGCVRPETMLNSWTRLLAWISDQPALYGVLCGCPGSLTKRLWLQAFRMHRNRDWICFPAEAKR